MRKIFVTGIDTEIGKTVTSAVLTEALQADYWKPVQAGDLDNTDTMKVRGLISNTKSHFHQETYRLNHPMSPHAAANLDGVSIDLGEINAPQSDNENLIIEGAGGLMVPLNDKYLMIDLIAHLGAEAVLVSKNYLGSINHTLLSAEILKNRGISVLGIIFNGEKNPTTEEYILHYTGLKELGKIPWFDSLDKDKILNLALDFRLV